MKILRLLSLISLLVPAVAAAQAEGITGIWEGVFARESHSQPVVLVCRPRGDSGVAGAIYFDGDEFGPIEDGRATTDSLLFHSGPFGFEASRSGDQLAVLLVIPHGKTHRFTLTRSSADTLKLPAALQNPAPHASRELKIPPAPDAVYRAHDLPPATTSEIDPALRRGTLFLVGGGAGQADLYARFLKLAGGPAATILDLPDATMALNGQTVAPDGHAMAALLGADHVGVLHAGSREAADSEAFVQPLRRANALWIDGGNAEAIIDRYMGTRTEREWTALLARGGTIGGTSAGALIWGSRVMVFRAHTEDKPYAGMRAEDLLPDDPHGPALGLLRNVTIVPHYAEFKMEASARRMLATHPGLLVIGIDEATALEVHGTTGTVLGRGHVTVFDGSDHGGQPFVVLSEGARYDLHRRVVL